MLIGPTRARGFFNDSVWIEEVPSKMNLAPPDRPDDPSGSRLGGCFYP